MKKTYQFLDKIKKIRRDQWIVVLLAGILMIIISLPSGQHTDAETQTVNEETQQTYRDTVSDMERRLEEILQNMEGAGKVRVMITQKDLGEKIVEKDTPSVSRTSQEEGSDGTARNTVEKEENTATVYERSGSGNETPYVTRELTPQVEGVLVLAEGADNAVVKKDITDAVMALFGLEAHKIKVMKMNERRG